MPSLSATAWAEGSSAALSRWSREGRLSLQPTNGKGLTPLRRHSRAKRLSPAVRQHPQEVCMNIALFYHSLRSDWNHGNAHFLRGIATELHARGHAVQVFEPEAAWSLVNLVAEHGEAPLHAFHQAYPHLCSTPYVLQQLDLDRVLEGMDLVIVHEWNEPELVWRLGMHHR